MTSRAERLGSLITELRNLSEEVRDQVDNTPDNLQSGERYERLEELADALESSLSELEGFEP